MKNYDFSSKNRGKRQQRFEMELRSCSCCGSAAGVEIAAYVRRSDIVSCQVCGAGYLLTSTTPIRLQPLALHDLDGPGWYGDD